MKAELRLDCKCCIEDISLDITIKGKTITPVRDIREKAQKQGWHLGRDCYCPSCYQALPAHCNTCEHYEGNKSMGAPICRRDGEFALPTDYCEYHQPFHSAHSQSFQGYKNPVPTLEDLRRRVRSNERTHD